MIGKNFVILEIKDNTKYDLLKLINLNKSLSFS